MIPPLYILHYERADVFVKWFNLPLAIQSVIEVSEYDIQFFYNIFLEMPSFTATPDPIPHPYLGFLPRY